MGSMMSLKLVAIAIVALLYLVAIEVGSYVIKRRFEKMLVPPSGRTGLSSLGFTR